MSRFRILFVNFSFRSTTNLLSKFIGLVTLPIITRALGPEGYANYNLATLIAQCTYLPVALLGLRIYGIREISGNRKEDSYASNIVSMQFTMAVLAVLISTIVTAIIFKAQAVLFISILIGYILVFANAFDLEFFYVAKKDLVFPTLTRLGGQIFYVLGVILFIKSPSDVPILVFFAASTLMISDLIQLKRFHTKHGKINFGLSFKEVFKTLKTTYQLGISTNLEGFYPNIPQLFIPILLGSYAFGIFSGGYKIFSILATFYVTLFYALAPYLVKLNSHTIKVRRKCHLLILIIVVFGGGISGLGLNFFCEPLLILILGNSFSESVVVFKTISLTLIPLTPISMLLGNILIYSGKDKYYLNTIAISTVTIFLVSPILIKNYNAIGGIYATAVAMLDGILVSIYYYFKME
jgi:O-antigen/teichoic acid export membrane protein